MCGIAGGTAVSDEFLDPALDRLRHRGPDARAVWRENGAGLAHTRLAVIDLTEGGAQPMHSACGRYVLAYNGEIYNFRELRADLEARDEQFRSTSDSEVLLACLRREGTGALDRLVGMFAFALWDRAEKSLLLARDRLGIKPLVYAPLGGGHLAFASEIGALRHHAGIDSGIDPEALSEYLACLYVPAPRTLYRGIRKLPPGHLLQWRNGRTSIRRWWRPRISGDRRVDHDAAVEEILPLVRRAVTDRLVADVPVGCFLSGGLDSSVVAALMAERARETGGPPVRTFTMTFDEAAYDERDNARRVADHIGAEHVELRASPRLAERLDACVDAFGEPFGNPTALLIDDLSAQARQHVTVALVGDGGDEVFGGYPRYRGGLLARRYRDAVPVWLRNRVIGPLAQWIPEDTRGRHAPRRAREFLTAAGRPEAEMYAAWVEYFDPAERARLLGHPAPPSRPIADLHALATSAHSLDAMQETDLGSFLPGNLLAYGDAMSMAHALELRLPLIDHRLIETVGRIAPDIRFQNGMKSLLRGIARRLLPAGIVDAPKRGFNPPMGVWLREDLAPMVAERLAPARMADLGLDPGAVADLLATHRRGRRDVALKVWALLVLEAWARRC